MVQTLFIQTFSLLHAVCHLLGTDSTIFLPGLICLVAGELRLSPRAPLWQGGQLRRVQATSQARVTADRGVGDLVFNVPFEHYP